MQKHNVTLSKHIQNNNVHISNTQTTSHMHDAKNTASKQKTHSMHLVKRKPQIREMSYGNASVNF